MQVHKGNILKTIRMLCNPNFISSVFWSEPYYIPLPSYTKEHQVKPYIYFLYPLASLPKIVKPGSSYFH